MKIATSLLDTFYGGVQCRNQVNHQDRQPQLSPRCTSVLGLLTTHDDSGGVDMVRARVPPLRLQAGAARVTHHNGSLVTRDLCKMTATRPVTTLFFYFTPLCAKPAHHHDTPHKDGRLFNATQKKKHAAPSNDTSRTRINRHKTKTCDARAEPRHVHWAWRGRGSPVPPEHDGERGSFLFSSVEGRHRTLPRGYHHGTFRRVAFLSCRQMQRLSEDRVGRHRSRQHHDHTAKRQAQVPDRSRSAHMTAISTSGHPRTPAHSHRTPT